MLWQAVDDLVQLLGRRGLVETLQIRKLVDDARILRGLEGPREASAAMLGAGLLDAEFDGLRTLESDVFPELGLEPLVNQALSVLREAKLLTVAGPPASQHWLHARAGELASWLILLGAVERKRRAAPTADLERTAAWVRSNFDNALNVSRAGPPPEVRLSAPGASEEALAASDRSISSLDGRRESAQRTDLHGRQLRAWAISWLADRLRVDESRIDPRRSFADHGVDSLAAVEFAKALADRVNITLDETLLWNFPTIDSLLTYLEKPPQPSRPAAPVAVGTAAAEADQPSEKSAIDEELERLERELAKRS
jgi:acyl carrier protein